MAVATQGINRAPRPSSLADVLEVILDKGIVIDAYVRVAVVGIELLTIDARIVIASVDTYLRFAEAVNRLDIQPQEQVAGLPGLVHEVTEGGAQHKTKGALEGVKDSAKDLLSSLGPDEDDEEEDDDSDGDERPTKRRRAPAERGSSRTRRTTRRTSEDS
jgi:gas vesicle structural protein